MPPGYIPDNEQKCKSGTKRTFILAPFEPLWFSSLPESVQIKQKCLALTDGNYWHYSNRNKPDLGDNIHLCGFTA